MSGPCVLNLLLLVCSVLFPSACSKLALRLPPNVSVSTYLFLSLDLYMLVAISTFRSFILGFLYSLIFAEISASFSSIYHFLYILLSFQNIILFSRIWFFSCKNFHALSIFPSLELPLKLSLSLFLSPSLSLSLSFFPSFFLFLFRSCSFPRSLFVASGVPWTAMFVRADTN